jgi:hypothetical protein
VSLIKNQACHSEHIVGTSMRNNLGAKNIQGRAAKVLQPAKWNIETWGGGMRDDFQQLKSFRSVESIRVSRFLHSNNSIHYISAETLPSVEIGWPKPSARARQRQIDSGMRSGAACLQSGLRWFAMCREWFCGPPPDLQVGCIINSVWIKPVRKLCLRRKELILKHTVELDALSVAAL